MSRCYPYPPPGYVRGEISLAESIKLQKEMEQQQESKKEKKRDHKDKKQKKKRPRSDHEQTKDERQIEKNRRLHDKEAKSDDKKVQSQLGEKVQPVLEEQLEKSGLTEEFGAAHLPYQCGSPDSSASEDSSKRRRVGDFQKTHVAQASGLRIRFALGKQKADVSPVAPVGVFKLPRAIPPAPEVVVRPPTLRRPTVIPAPAAPAPFFREPEVVHISSLPSMQQEIVVIPESPERPSFSGRSEPATTPDGRSPAVEGYRGSKKSRKKEAKYNDLFLNWTASPLSELGCLGDDDDENWLFKSSYRQPRPQHQQQDTSTCLDQSSQPLPDSSICSWSPRACHLEDVDVFALPYVLPF